MNISLIPGFLIRLFFVFIRAEKRLNQVLILDICSHFLKRKVSVYVLQLIFTLTRVCQKKTNILLTMK